MGKRELMLFDHIGDDDDQDVLAVLRLGKAQLAGLSIHPVAGRDNIINSDQTVLHKGCLQACVLRGILGLDQRNLDILVTICLLGRGNVIVSFVAHAQSPTDCIVVVDHDLVYLDDLAIPKLNSIVQSDLAGISIRLSSVIGCVDNSLDSLQGVLSSLIHVLVLPDFMILLGSTDTILPHACAYARPILIAAPLMMSSLVMNNILRYEGKASFAMIGLVTGGVLNIVLDPVFIFGLGMGTGGAGTATALSQSISFCILLSMFLRGKTVSRFRITQVTRSARDFGQIFFNGAPSFGRQGLNSIGSMLLNVAARNYGDAAVAGMSIVSRIFQFVLSVAIGVGQGLQPVAAFNYGARRFARVRKAAIFTISTAFVFMAVLNSLCWFNAEPLIRLFRDDPEVTAVALPALRYQCVAMFLQPVIIVTNMMFQSIGKSGRATFLACCRQGVCFIPLILTLPHIWGLSGIELCQPIADGLTFCISVPFLLPFLKELKEQGDEE